MPRSPTWVGSSLYKTYYIETDAKREPDKERDAECAADGQPEAAGYDVVVAAGFDLFVGGNRRDTQPRRHRYYMRDDDDANRHPQTGLPDDPGQAQIHNDADNRQY